MCRCHMGPTSFREPGLVGLLPVDGEVHEGQAKISQSGSYMISYLHPLTVSSLTTLSSFSYC